MKPFLDDTELYLFNTGKSAYAYRSLGCHQVRMEEGYNAWRFAVWAPNARAVSVVGDFNGWDIGADGMQPLGTTGVWQAHIGIVDRGGLYKYAILTESGEVLYKADPFAFYSELRPNTASVVRGLGEFAWTDGAYLENRAERNLVARPMSIYELHTGSWKAGLGYEGLARELVAYVCDMGYTHIELMPLCEYPLDDSWGYQVTGYYSITSRYGDPDGLKALVNACHEADIGVILDWVPAHFARDAHGLRRFDGTPLYEHPDPRLSDQPQWGTLMFNYERLEVQSFLISNAVYLLSEFHIDALRVDAVSCMLYLDYGREAGGWVSNSRGGRENLGAIGFLQNLARAVGRECPGALLIAEESTAFPLVTMPPHDGGLGFHFKWNMGFMNDTLSYFGLDSYHRRFHHGKLTFPMCYAFSENFILPFSHDEVVHGKRSLIARMPGSYEDQFAQLRALYMYQYAHPGKKLLFMGGEFGQFAEWDFRASLDWHLLDFPLHRDLRQFVRALNALYRATPALYEQDDRWAGFEWRAVDDANHSVIAFIRRDGHGRELLCAFNFTPAVHPCYRIPMACHARLVRVMCNLEKPADDIRTLEADGRIATDIPLSPYEAVYYLIEPEGGCEP